MGHDAAARRDDQVRRAERRVGGGGLPRRLARGEHRHDRAGLVLEHRRQAGAGRLDHALVRLRELVLQAVDVHVVGAGEPPESSARPRRTSRAADGGRGSPSRCGGRGSAARLKRPSSIMPTSPTEFRLAIRQVAPWARSVSWRRRIWSRSPVRLKANMAFLPVRSASASMTRITARTRSSKGQSGPSDWSSSSLMKSIPASHSSCDSAAVSSGSRPTLGLMMVPMSGRPSTPASRRVPGDAEARAGIGVGEGRRQPDVEKFQAAHRLQLEQVAGDGGDEIGKRRAERRQGPGQRHPGERDALALGAPAGGSERSRTASSRTSSAIDAGGRALLQLRRLARDRRRRCRSTARRPWSRPRAPDRRAFRGGSRLRCGRRASAVLARGRGGGIGSGHAAAQAAVDGQADAR